jgi:hypothetical protein
VELDVPSYTGRCSILYSLEELMGSASCDGDPIWHVQAAIGRALRDEGDPTQPLPDHLAALVREIDYLNGVVDEQACLRMILEAGTIVLDAVE